MTTIISRKLLPQQRDKYILVERDNQLYVRAGDEYLRKQYFYVKEVISILGMSRDEVHRRCVKMGIQAHANRRKKLRITLTQLRQMAKLK